MSRNLVYAVLIQLGLIVVTSILLAQPAMMFPAGSERMRSFMKAGGWLFLCVTFCWSVVVGCLLSLDVLILRI